MTQRIAQATRAGAVTRGPDWDGDAGGDVVIGPRRRNRTRWWAPLAAAVVVLAVIGTTLALRSEPSGPALHTGHQEPVPAGMKAVDALGVEIFVPQDMAVDPGPCGSGVFRPVAMPRRMPSCPPRRGPRVTIGSIEPSTGAAPQACTGQRLALGRESACTTTLAAVGLPPAYEVSWPGHGVSITTDDLDHAAALKILSTAHAVALDRNGCVGRDDTLDVVPKPAPGTFNAQLLPRSSDSLSVCWYIGNRLVASALLDKDKARQVIGVANGMAPMYPARPPHPELLSCQSLAQTDAVLLIAHAAGRDDVTATTHFANCDGEPTSWSPTADFLTSADLATAIAKATGIPLELGYLPGN